MINSKVMIVALSSSLTLGAFVIDKNTRNIPAKNPTLGKKIQQTFLAQPCEMPRHVRFVSDPLALAQLAQDTLDYFNRVPTRSCFEDYIFDQEKTKQTLQFLVDTIEQDKRTGVFRIQDPSFIKQHFKTYAWKSDYKAAHKVGKPLHKQVERDNILLTHYMVLTCQGSYKKTEQTPYALYALKPPFDKGLPFTKQQVLEGILEKNPHKTKVRRLVWLSRESLESTLMQGSAFITMPDGKVRLFTVHLNNNIVYDKSIKNPYDQARYWYFQENITDDIAHMWQRYQSRKDIVVAGDMDALGVGKLIMMTYRNNETQEDEVRLAIVADTGGAFENNLFQLDNFAGMSSSSSALMSSLKYMPVTVSAYVLCKKE